MAPNQSANLPQTRWKIAFAAALMNALQSGAFFFTPTTLMPLIVADFGLSLSVSTVPIAVGKIAYVLLLIPGGMLVDHYGPRMCVLLGIAGLAFLMTFYSLFVSSFWFMLCMHILLATVASVSGVPVYSIFVAQWFQGGIGLAMGLVLAGYSAAGTAIPALLGNVASAFGWRVAMGCMCGLLWMVALPVTYLFLHEYHYTEEEVEAERIENGSVEVVVGGLGDEGLAETKSWTFVGFAFSYILLQYCFGCFGENVMFFLTLDRNVSIAVASLFFSALNLSAFVAKLVGGHLGDRFDRFHVASASSGLAALGIVFLFVGSDGLDEDYIPTLTTHGVAVLVFTIMFGFGYGATFNCLYALTPIVFGKKNLGRTQSTLFGLGLAGNAVGSVLTGVLRSRYETYQRPFLVAGMACLANFFVFNITRMTLGGSLEGLKALYGEQSREDRYANIEELDAAEEAARLRLGDYSDSGFSPKVSPLGSFATYGATFASLGGEGETIERTEGTTVGITRSSSRHSGSGMQIEQGFPIVRDWSSSSLRASISRSESVASGGSGGLRARVLRKSSTMEAIIESGILSASLEAAGYVGKQTVANAQSVRHAASGGTFAGSPILRATPIARRSPDMSTR